MKQRIISTGRIFLLVVAVAASLLLLAPAGPRAYAKPVPPGGPPPPPPVQNCNPIAAGCKCDLPDGSTNGVISTDGRTCCPSNLQDHTAKNWATNCFYAKYINPAIALVSAAVGVIVVISVIFGAFQVVTAGDDVSKVAAGRKRIVEALIGLLAYAALYALFQFLVPGGI